MPLLANQQYIAGYQYPVLYQGPVVNTAQPDRYDLSRLYQLIRITVSLSKAPTTNQASIGCVYENSNECYIRPNVFDGMPINTKQPSWVFHEHFIGVQNSVNVVILGQSPYVTDINTIEAGVHFNQRQHFGGK